ncbi:MAG TPA: hypothetical protein VF746_03160 [Longimicrobium sp.]|jgi:hypothetical protein
MSATPPPALLLLGAAATLGSLPGVAVAIERMCELAESEASAPAVPCRRGILLLLPPAVSGAMARLLESAHDAAAAVGHRFCDTLPRDGPPGSRDGRAARLLREAARATARGEAPAVLAELRRAAENEEASLVRIDSSALPDLTAFFLAVLDAAAHEPHGQASLFEW